MHSIDRLHDRPKLYAVDISDVLHYGPTQSVWLTFITQNSKTGSVAVDAHHTGKLAKVYTVHAYAKQATTPTLSIAVLLFLQLYVVRLHNHLK